MLFHLNWSKWVISRLQGTLVLVVHVSVFYWLNELFLFCDRSAEGSSLESWSRCIIVGWEVLAMKGPGVHFQNSNWSSWWLSSAGCWPGYCCTVLPSFGLAVRVWWPGSLVSQKSEVMSVVWSWCVMRGDLCGAFSNIAHKTGSADENSVKEKEKISFCSNLVCLGRRTRPPFGHCINQNPRRLRLEILMTFKSIACRCGLNGCWARRSCVLE